MNELREDGEVRSKGQQLCFLQDKLTKFFVPESFLFSVQNWTLNPEQLINQIQKRFHNGLLIIRSSASDEDGRTQTLAGKYHSVLNVQCNDGVAVEKAISQVILSYEKNDSSQGNDEILVQKMVQKVTMSGVAFTHELNSGAPYYVINYDDESGLTNTVTSGGGEYANRTLYIHRAAANAIRSERFQLLVEAVQELEQFLDSEFLDIEFALDEQLQPYLLQVRTITTQPNWNRAVTRRIDAELYGIQHFVRERFRPAWRVFGSTTVLSQMSDWNPAEMIGRAPRALSRSLYEILITDHSWRYARDRMGYATPNGRALMVALGGQPFVDTRLSFHSYLPADLPETVANKLVDAWVARLCAHPELHDKIEFEVAITAFSFDIDDKLDRLVGEVLSIDERQLFRESLRRLTLPLLLGEGEGAITTALAQVNLLASRRLPSADSGLLDLQPMIEDCTRLGTVPFAVLARHGFIARTLLLSLVSREILTVDDVASFQASVRTVATDLVEDMRRLGAGTLTLESFMQKYGHLRPGTYDILSPRYDQMSHFATGGNYWNYELSRSSQKIFELNEWQRVAIEDLLMKEGLEGLDCDRLLAYCADAITGREYGKFVFTRSVSAILELIAKFGECYNLSREEISHLPLSSLLEIVQYSTDISIEERLRSIAEREADRHELTSAIRLPQVLFDEAGVHVVPFQVSQPNFITSLKVTADITRVDAHQITPSVGGCIVLIENADPGYDWIFAKHIAGLVTKYGGANSHMAIRCAEFGIPAAIGCGEQRYETFLQARRLCLDCSAGLITTLH